VKNVVNQNMAGCDLNVSGTTYTGDAAGIFAMEDAHADRVLQMPGWALSPTAPTSAEDVDPVANLRTATAGPKPPAPAPAPTAPPPAEEPPPPPVESVEELQAKQAEQAAEEAPEAEEEEPEEEGPDLDAATTKTALYAIAEEYGVKLTTKQKKLPVDEIRAILDTEIYGEDD
jgi:hypothetical protein